MPRNSSGTYSLPPLNPVVTGTIIESDWANSTMEDVASSITNSLSRTGAGGMLAPLTHVNGTNLLPSITFLNDLQTGIFLDGIGNMTFTVSTQPLFRVSAANGVQVFIDGVWSAIGGFFDGPNPDLSSIDAAIISGTNDPTNAPHMALGFNVVQTKDDETTAGIMRINPYGGSVFIGPSLAGSSTGNVNLLTDLGAGPEVMAQTIAATAGGLSVNNTLTGVGLERVLTESDLTFGGSNTFDGPNPDLVDNDSAIIVGTDSPATNPHIAGGPTTWQAKANTTTAAAMDINPLGGDLTLGAQSGAGNTSLYQAGKLRVSFDTGPFPVGMTLSNDGTNGLVMTDETNTTQQAFVGVIGTDININNEANGGNQTYNGKNASGDAVELMDMNPDFYSGLAAVEVPRLVISEYYNGDVFSGTYAPSLSFRGESGPFGGMDIGAGYIDSDGDLSLQPYGGGDVILGTSESGTGGVTLWHDNNFVGETVSPAEGGLKINNQATATGFERVLTEVDISTLWPKVLSTITGNINKNNDTTYSQSSGSLIPRPNGEGSSSNFRLEIQLSVVDNPLSGFKVRIFGANSIGGVFTYDTDEVGGSKTVTTDAVGTIVVPATTYVKRWVRFSGHCSISGSGSTVTLGFAQNVATVGETSLLNVSNFTLTYAGGAD